MATLNWGDGSSTTTGSVSGTGPFTAGGTHPYASAGVYNAALTLTDSGGSSTTTQSTITVTNPSGPGSLTITLRFAWR